MITVGLDFGTHQTKVCIEKKEGVELNYTFMKFEDTYLRELYTFPSVVGVDKDNLLHYGYLKRDFKGKIFKYFKQSAFDTNAGYMPQVNAWYFSAWYIAYLLFDLEQKYGQQFAIQMGAPTDSSHVDVAKQIATRIVASAYRLVEDVFENDKERFLATPIRDLVELTEIVPFSQEIKEKYGLLVFPEAYACLMPLISQGKLEKCMNLMIDIGGGTTDISFFTIEKDNDSGRDKPQVYAFYSLDKGLNFLTRADDEIRPGVNSNVANASEIDPKRLRYFQKEIKKVCSVIRNSLHKYREDQTSFGPRTLNNALKGRPLVYTGGGSTFKILRSVYDTYEEIRLISDKEWNDQSVEDIEYIIKSKLCPILSTAYGLSISTEDDNIVMKPFSDIFKDIREKDDPQKGFIYSTRDKFDYGIDFNAWK